MSYSIVKYYGKQGRNQCGYCKSPNTSFSHGMWAYTLSVENYQALIDRGWRRSGKYCYKPIMDVTCCPMYTIRCEALHFKVTKSQKKILKRMAKFLRNELKQSDMDTTEEDQDRNIDINSSEISNYKKHLIRAEENASEMKVLSVENELSGKLYTNIVKEKNTNIEREQASLNMMSQSNHDSSSELTLQDTSTQQTESNCTQPTCKKAKLLRIERKKMKLIAQGKSQKEIENIMKESKRQNYTKTIEDLFNEIYDGTNTLEMKLVRVMSEEFFKSFHISANLYKKYQMAIHGDEPEACDKQSFFNFLAKGPLQHTTSNQGPPQGYGSFHEQYWLNNELIAVAVIDILPSCISSVYFFYDPAYSHLSLGTFSSLREIYLTRQMNKIVNNIKYYYMGFYIHTCPKMRYKAKMSPSKLLCPETYTWCNIDTCMLKLDKEKYSRFNEDLDTLDEDGIVDISKISFLHHGTAVPYMIYKKQVKDPIEKEEEEEIIEYASLVGMKCAQNLLFYR